MLTNVHKSFDKQLKILVKYSLLLMT